MGRKDKWWDWVMYSSQWGDKSQVSCCLYNFFLSHESCSQFEMQDFWFWEGYCSSYICTSTSSLIYLCLHTCELERGCQLSGAHRIMWICPLSLGYLSVILLLRYEQYAACFSLTFKCCLTILCLSHSIHSQLVLLQIFAVFQSHVFAR